MFHHKTRFPGSRPRHWFLYRLLALPLLLMSAGTIQAAEPSIREPSILEVDTSAVPADLPPRALDHDHPPLPSGVRIPINKLPNNAYGVAPAPAPTQTTAPQSTSGPAPIVPATPQRTTPQTGR